MAGKACDSPCEIRFEPVSKQLAIPGNVVKRQGREIFVKSTLTPRFMQGAEHRNILFAGFDISVRCTSCFPEDTALLKCLSHTGNNFVIGCFL